MKNMIISEYETFFQLDHFEALHQYFKSGKTSWKVKIKVFYFVSKDNFTIIIAADTEGVPFKALHWHFKRNISNPSQDLS